MKEVVVRIKYDESTSKDVLELVDILKEEKKPSWRTDIEGWKGGPRSLSDRAIALMKAQIDSHKEKKAPRQGASPISNTDPEDNLFG